MADERVASLLERAFMFLEDGEWQKADEYCEKVLDTDPKNAEAYLGKLMAEYNVNKRDSLKLCTKPLEESRNYQKILAFGDEKLVDEIKTANESSKDLYSIKNQNTKKLIKKAVVIGVPVIAVIVVLSIVLNSYVFPAIKQNKQYEKALALAKDGELQQAMCILEELDDYKDSADLLKEYRCDFAARDTISAGSSHTAAVKSDGTVVVAGQERTHAFDDNFEFRTTYDVSDFTDIIAVSVGTSHTVGLKSDGTVVAEFHDNVDYAGQCGVGDWEDIISVSAGSYHTVGLKADGTVVATEYGQGDYFGQCEVEGWKDIIAVSAGDCQTLGLKADGTVVTTEFRKEHNFAGGDDYGQFEVDGWTDIVAISAGGGHAVGLKSDGTVVAVGANNNGQCNVEYWTDIVAISAGQNHTVGLKSDGTVVATGYTGDYRFYYGQSDVEYWYDIVAISAGDNHTVGLRSDGTVIATKYTGEHDYGQCDVDGWKNIKIPDNIK